MNLSLWKSKTHQEKEMRKERGSKSKLKNQEWWPIVRKKPQRTKTP